MSLPIDPIELVDPALREGLALLPALDFSKVGLPEVRQALAAMRVAEPPPAGALMPEERFAPGPAGRQVRMLVWRTPGATGPLPAVLHMHGGGYVLGSPDFGEENHRALVETMPCMVVAVQYALAPEQPHPQPVEDCYTALRWMSENAAELGIDPARIGVSGVSAGGGLAAALALLARDRGEIPLAFQHLIYPMLDDRTCTAEDPHPHTGHWCWNNDSNHFGWSALLGVPPGSEGVSPYAAPARATDLAGLPPTYLSVGMLDLFLEENLEYARRLSRAAVPVELHAYPGAYHSFDNFGDVPVAAQARRDNNEALMRFLRG